MSSDLEEDEWQRVRAHVNPFDSEENEGVGRRREELKKERNRVDPLVIQNRGKDDEFSIESL